MGAVDPGALLAPSLADIDALARAAFAALPQAVRARCPDLAISVEELAEEALVEEFDLDDAFELTGFYEGAGPGERLSGDLPDRVRLFRRAILDEWIERGNVTLEELVRHVLVHEIAHHLGMTDADIARIDDWTA